MTEIDATLAERGTRYGDFSEGALVADSILSAMSDAPNWTHLTSDKRIALLMIGMKLSRILNGDPDHADSWRDMAGYATLAEQRCKPS